MDTKIIFTNLRKLISSLAFLGFLAIPSWGGAVDITVTGLADAADACLHGRAGLPLCLPGCFTVMGQILPKREWRRLRRKVPLWFVPSDKTILATLL